MQETPTYTLHKLVFALDRSADALLRSQFNISYSRALVLVVLKEASGITQHQLAQELGHTDPAVSAILTELTKEGYVTSQVSPVHKRKKEVHLTPRGQELADKMYDYLSGKFESLLKAAGVDIALYHQMTKQIYTALDDGEK
jgi:DNA-binding MarR family transcriptional regulator